MAGTQSVAAVHVHAFVAQFTGEVIESVDTVCRMFEPVPVVAVLAEIRVHHKVGVFAVTGIVDIV